MVGEENVSEETAQLDSAEAALEKDGIGGFRLRQREFAHDGAGARERIHRLRLGEFAPDSPLEVDGFEPSVPRPRRTGGSDFAAG